MKNLKVLLRLATGVLVASGSTLGVIACSTDTTTGAVSITGVQVSDLEINANVNATNGYLNDNAMINSAVANAINSALNVSVQPMVDFYLTNTQVQDQMQMVGASVQFTVHATGNQIKDSFDFTITLSKASIKNITVNDLQTTPNLNWTYGDLNNNNDIRQAVVNAISDQIGISAVAGTDFILTNDQIATAQVTPGTKVTFTVKPTGSLIQDSFQFVDTLGFADITGVTVPDLKTNAVIGNTYAVLNTDATINQAVVNAINQTLNINIGTSDITLSNDQVGNQTPGTIVTFTVTPASSQITGQFSFIDTLQAQTIANVTIPAISMTANPNGTYNDLNNSNMIKRNVIAAINNQMGTAINANDIILTNNQTPTANQQIGTAVQMTVTASPTSTKIAGTTKVTVNLGTISINSGVTVTPPIINAVTTAAYSTLTTNTTLVNAVVSAINTAKGTNITSADINLAINKTGNQVAGGLVTVYVTAAPTSTLITGGFNFSLTLNQVNISTGVTVTDPATAYTSAGATYGSLNTNGSLIAAVVAAINTAKGTTITANDITLTNDQSSGSTIVPGQLITFTVTANASSQITGSFTFTDTIGKASISGVTVATLPQTNTLGIDPTATYGSLNTARWTIYYINNAINQATGINPVVGTDYTVTNNQTATSLQTSATVVIFTITATATGKLTGSFTWSVTVGSRDIGFGVYVPNIGLVANPTQSITALLTNTTLLNTINEAINTQYASYVTANDYILSLTPTSGNQYSSENVLFKINPNGTGKIGGAPPTFYQYLI